MLKTFFVLLCLLCVVLTLSLTVRHSRSQEPGPVIIRPAIIPEPYPGMGYREFRGLKIDQATPDLAIRTLGQPVSDSVDRLDVIDAAPLNDRHQEPVFRRLIWKGKHSEERPRQVELGFLEDRLVMIEFAADGRADGLFERFGGLRFAPRAIAGQTYPNVYGATAVTDYSIISALIMNDTSDQPRDDHLPGHVSREQIISRRLELGK